METLAEKAQRLGMKPAGKPVATSTAPVGETLTQKAQRLGVKPVQPTQPEPKQDGFLKSLAKDVAGTLVVNPVSRVTELATRTFAPNSLAAQGYREGGDMNVLGVTVPEQKAFGQGGLKQIVGDAAKSASYLYGGGAVGQVGKASLAGRIGQGFLQGAKGGAVSGALYGGGSEIQKDDATVGSVLKETALGGAIGGVTGGVLGGALPVVPALVKGAKPEKIMQRVARVNALDQEKFAQTAKESIGEYLVMRGIYGNDDEIVNQLATRFSESKSVADDALSKLQGNWKNGAVDDALSDLAEREARVSSKNVPSRDMARVSELSNKHRTQGLTMSEINEVKRLYERNVKLGYLKERNTDMVARSTGIDDAIRTWQFSQADKLGLKNLGEINRETRLARQLGDALLKKNARSGGNNAFGLTDAILISGGDPQAISMLIAKRTFGSKGVQSAIAKKLAPDATVGTPSAIFGKRAPNKDIFPSTVIPSGESTFGTLDLSKKPANAVGTRVSIPVQEAKATQGGTKQSPQQSQTKVESVSLPPTIPPKATKSSKGVGTVLPNKTGSEAFAGGIAGIEKDENGEWTFNKEKALAGMIGVAGLTRSKTVQELSKKLTTHGNKILDDFITVVDTGAVSKTKDGLLTFKAVNGMTADEVETAFMEGLKSVNNNKVHENLESASPKKISNFFKEILDEKRAIGKAKTDALDPKNFKSAEEFVKGDKVIYNGDEYTFVKNYGVSGDKRLIEDAYGRQTPVLPEQIKKSKDASGVGKYGMSHRPTKTGATADDISKGGEVIPEDFYEHPEWYANMRDKAYQESWRALQSVKGKPNADITIYRASPKNELNDGDWVTLSKEYAKGESLSENTPVHSFKVKAKDIQFAGDDINEFGYYPNQK